MEENPDEMYIINHARSLNPTEAKCWMLTAMTLFPKSFNTQFQAYKLEKEARNYQEAAKVFSALPFQNQNPQLWNEVNELTNALRTPENEMTPAQEFYVKMFQHVSLDVQQKILLLTINQTELSINQCRLLLLTIKRFPQAATTHTPRLLEMIIDGMKLQDHPQKYQELLVDEVLPLLYNKASSVDLPSGLVRRLFMISLEYYVHQIFENDIKCDTNEMWRKVFQILLFCGRIQKWEAFLPFNKNWGQNIYWDKLVEIISIISGGTQIPTQIPTQASTQVLYYAATLFIYSLHSYLKYCNDDDPEMNHVLVEGFTERIDAKSIEPPMITVTTPASKDISMAFLHAAQCWQLLNTEQYQQDFSKLMLSLPLSSWISRFIFDLAMYFGHQGEAKRLMTDVIAKSSLIQNLQLLSLNLVHGAATLQGFECVLKVLTELPTTQGQSIDNLTQKVPRHVIFIPLTQRAVVQYCTKAIVNSLSRKLYETNCSDRILGDLLVLLQLEYPRETLMAEQIFALIVSRRSFSYRLMPAYIIQIDFIEEFMHIWNTHNEDFNFDFSQSSQSSAGLSGRRIGTRGADKGARDDFRMVIRSQIARANENLTTLVANFIKQEYLKLVHNIFGGEQVAF